MASPTEKMETSAVIDMDDDHSDYETDFAPAGSPTDGSTTEGSQTQGGSSADDLKSAMAKNMTSYMWQTGTQQAKKAFNIYANIDILRPYFDVEPHQVRLRLLQSLVPRVPGSATVKVPRELYGPTMLVFTMIALLLFQMKTSGHYVEEGTLMGSAFGICFGYWLGVSSFVWFLAYVCNTHITMLQILNLLGYALFGHCIVLGLTTIVHTSHDHMFFYVIWAIFGGLSTLKMISVLMSRTAGQTQKLIVCGTVAAFHLLFLIYLHFAYHQIVEELSSVIDNLPNQAFKPAVENKLNIHEEDPIKKVVESGIGDITKNITQGQMAKVKGNEEGVKDIGWQKNQFEALENKTPKTKPSTQLLAEFKGRDANNANEMVNLNEDSKIMNALKNNTLNEPKLIKDDKFK